jgi:hypothetical protein
MSDSHFFTALSSLKESGGIVSEDSRIFWNAFLAHDGDYYVTPLSYPVSMDANLDNGLWATIKSIYKQQRRWAWGVENLPYVLFGFIKNKAIIGKTKPGKGK